MRNLLRKLRRKAQVILKAVPTYGAAAVALLTAFSTSVVPALPVSWQVKAGAYVAAAVGAVSAIVAVVSRVTPILWPDDKGLLIEPRDNEFVNVVGSDEFWSRPDDDWAA